MFAGMLVKGNIKKLIVCTLLCVYSLALIKPVIPIVNDIIAHAFYKMEHLATVHFENGKYHVHDELEKSAPESSSKNSIPSNLFETLSNHLKDEPFVLFINRTCISKITFPYINNPVDVNLNDPTPPPKA